jgi:hypothetical protein
MQIQHVASNTVHTLALATALAVWSGQELNGQTETDGQIVVKSLDGTASVVAGTNTPAPLTAGDALADGAVVEVDAAGQVDLYLDENGATPLPRKLHKKDLEPSNLARLYSSTVLGVDRVKWLDSGVEVITDSQFNLRRGAMLAKVVKLTTTSRFEVKIPNGVLGLREPGVFTVTAGGDLAVLSGTVVIAYVTLDGSVNTVVVSGRQTFECATGSVGIMSGALQKDLTHQVKSLEHS